MEANCQLFPYLFPLCFTYNDHKWEKQHSVFVHLALPTGSYLSWTYLTCRISDHHSTVYKSIYYVIWELLKVTEQILKGFYFFPYKITVIINFSNHIFSIIE